MTTAKAKEAIEKLKSQIVALESVPGVATSERDRDALRKRESRKKRKELLIPACEDPERRARLEADDEAWLLWYFAPESNSPAPYTYKFTLQQSEMIKALAHAMVYGGDQAVAASRGEGKSTNCERVILKYTLMGLIHFSVLFAATGSAAQDSLDSIKEELETNDRLLADYPEVCVPVRALENTPSLAHYQIVTGVNQKTGKEYSRVSSRFSWCGDGIVFPNVPGSPSARSIIATRGLDSVIRGVKKKGKRVDVAVIDDPDTEETVNSSDQQKKLENRVDLAIAGLGSQKRTVARCALVTIQKRGCFSHRFTDPEIKHSWKGKRYRFLIKKPDRADLWAEYVAIRQLDWQKGTNLATQFYAERRELMDAGAIVANPNRHTPEQLSALQHYYDLVARIGQDAVSTEYDNDPPADASVEQVVLTAYHIQHNCRSGLDQKVVPSDTVMIGAGVDVKKLGLHYSVWAFNAEASGCCIDYGFYDLHTEEEKDWNAVERAILRGLHGWADDRDEDPYVDLEGNDRRIDLSIVDRGWKEKTWATQPVNRFCGERGFNRFLPSKGDPNYRTPKPSNQIIANDNCHISFFEGLPTVMMNSAHWKQKVHEGFLSKPGTPGSLALFNPPESRLQPHMGYAKHITAEVWERRFKPGFAAIREGWHQIGTQNHWFDATYQALVARALRGISTLAPPAAPVAPVPQPQATVTVSRYSDDVRPMAVPQRHRW